MRLSSLFFLGIGIYVCFHARHLGLGRLHEPGPGFIFFLAGVLLAILSALDLWRTNRGRSAELRSLEKLGVGLKWRKVLFILMALGLWAYGHSGLGFFPSTFALLVFLFRVVEPMKWWMALVTAFLTVSISYLVFHIWLQIPFPEGVLGI